MSDIKSKGQGIDPNAHARNVNVMARKTGNIYESLNVIAHRSNQLSVQLKEELKSKLDEFSTTSDGLEEISENKEQIEISKFYEKMPNTPILAIHEFMEDKLNFRYKGDE